MKRRTIKQRQQQRKNAEREQAMFRSGGSSQYAKKVKAGQMYGPVPHTPPYPDFRPGDCIRRHGDTRRPIDRGRAYNPIEA